MFLKKSFLSNTFLYYCFISTISSFRLHTKYFRLKIHNMIVMAWAYSYSFGSIQAHHTSRPTGNRITPSTTTTRECETFQHQPDYYSIQFRKNARVASKRAATSGAWRDALTDYRMLRERKFDCCCCVCLTLLWISVPQCLNIWEYIPESQYDEQGEDIFGHRCWVRAKATALLLLKSDSSPPVEYRYSGMTSEICLQSAPNLLHSSHSDGFLGARTHMSLQATVWAKRGRVREGERRRVCG